MNSLTKQCPACAGRGNFYKEGANRHYTSKCRRCKGTGVISSPDPTTAGSETPAGPSRRRSLPALAAVLNRVETMTEEARGTMSKLEYDTGGYAHHRARGRLEALEEVLAAFFEVMSEEPEGNNPSVPPAQ